MISDEMKQEMRHEKDSAKVKTSLKCSQSKCEERESQLQGIKTRLSMAEERLEGVVKRRLTQQFEID